MESESTPQNPEVPWLKNLSACVEEMKSEGYQEDFRVSEEGLMTFDGKKKYSPQQVKIVNFYRFEGPSDPGDMNVLYVIETDDGTKGTLSDGFGTYADEEVAKFIVEVEKIQKVKVTDLHA